MLYTCTHLIEDIFDLITKLILILPGLKGLNLMYHIFKGVYSITPCDVIIIQNPPCIPAVIAAYLISIMSGSVICIDWHNLGFSMFAIRLGDHHVLVRVVRHLERLCAMLVPYHICVSKAMADWIALNFNVRPVVLYDRPPSIFLRAGLSLKKRHAILAKLDLADQLLFPYLGKWYGLKGPIDCQNPASTSCAACAMVPWGRCEMTVQTYRDVPSSELESKDPEYWATAPLADEIGKAYGSLRIREDRAAIVGACCVQPSSINSAAIMVSFHLIIMLCFDAVTLSFILCRYITHVVLI